MQITVGTSGTGGGFEKFCAGETDISDASRPIKPDEEAPVCKKAGVKYDEVQVANDGIAVVTNKNLDGRLPHGRPAQASCGSQGSKVTSLNESTPTPARTRSCRSTARAPTPARSTSSPARSTARRA